MSQVKIPFGRRPTVGQDGPRSRDVQSVSALVKGAHALLESRFSNLWVQGEISGLKLAGTGHAYFSLVDDKSAVSVAMWQSNVRRLRFRLQEGQEVLLRGSLGIYVKSGRFQFYAQTAEPAGAGARALEFERIKGLLQAEGLCDAGRKRPLPPWPRRIGLVTSAKGAALHDILQVGQARCPMRYVLADARVQGDEAPASLVRALGHVARVPGVDVIILGRGGGAAEDLAAFNDEALARAVAACPVPVVSAVGHEVDVSICDLVADARAATPTHGAELVVPDRRVALRRLTQRSEALERALQARLLEPRRMLEQRTYRLERVARALVAGQRRRVESLSGRALLAVRDRLSAQRERRVELQGRLSAAHPVRQVRRDRERLAQLEARLHELSRRAIQGARLRLTTGAAKLEVLSPLGVLGRGYALVTGPEGRVVTDAADVDVGSALDVRLARGRLRATVLERET